MRPSTHIRWALLFASLVLVIGSSTAAHAVAILHVANNGEDLAACGSTAQPCRSINKAIALASPGDTIVVGPGRYGTAEEGAPAGCICMINVSKKLTITSRDGASATVLDAGGAAVDVVAITVSDVAFGKKKKGFSIVNGSNGLSIAAGITGAKVTGNQAGGSIGGAGFELDGNDAVVTGNQSAANGFSGFSVRGTGHTLVGNLAAGNSFHGFVIFGSGHSLTGNIATDNPTGFSVADGAGPGIELTRNEAVGNTGPGINIGAGVTGVVVNNGNIFGNDPGGSNCGLSNASGITIDATNNFWGAAGGGQVLTQPTGSAIRHRV